MSFDIHPAVFVTVTLFMAVFAWITFAVTCYIKRRNFINYEDKDQKDGNIHADPSSIVIAHTGTDFKSGDRDEGDTGGDTRGDDNSGTTNTGGETSGGDGGGVDAGGYDAGRAMSFMVTRGKPTESQLFLDQVLDAVLRAGATRPGATRPEDVNLAEVLYYCMRTNPDAVHMINGATGEKFTNEQILKRAVSIARAYRSMGATGKTVVVLLRNHEHMAALYYAMLLAGVISLTLEPSTSGEDLQYSIALTSPCMVVCEADHRDEVTTALQQTGVVADVLVADDTSISDFARGHSSELDTFEFPNVGPESTVLMLNTSGSTGRPGTVLLTHEGLMAQLPFRWLEGSKFPRPTALALHLTTGQWLSHAKMMNSCPVYQVPLLVSPACTPNTPENVVKLVEKYKPTLSFTNLHMAMALINMMTAEQLSCFEIMGIAGTPFTAQNTTHLKEKFRKCVIVNNYGITEMQGSLAMSTNASTPGSVGEFHNFVHYKIVNTGSGEEISEPNIKGELYLKSKYAIKGYLNKERKMNFTPDGWMKTGDIFYKDDDGELFFAYRRSLGFKVDNKMVYPEDVETAIYTIPGVQQCVVCGADAGPAAAVVLRPGCDVTRDQMHHAVDCNLKEWNRLSGGITFVPSLPHFKGGKMNRVACLQLIKEMTIVGKCFT